MKTFKRGYSLKDVTSLENYYNMLKDNFVTGVDRVSSSKFASIKNDEFGIIISKYNKQKYRFSRYRIITHPNRKIFSPTIRDKIVLKYLSKTIQRKYKIKFNCRTAIIKSLILLLQDKMPYQIIRTDIKSFYDSIPIKNIFCKIKDTSLLTSSEYSLLSASLRGCKFGLPQGLSISAILSEIAMEKVDYSLSRLSNTELFYKRYVDDIIMVFAGDSYDIQKIVERAKNIVSENGLKLNDAKTTVSSVYSKLNNSDTKFEYLGYCFQFSKKILKISVSDIKFKKEESKIKKIFIDFKKNNNLNLLYFRLLEITRINAILTFGYNIPNESYLYVFKYGFIESYKQINDYECLKKLDGLIKHNIHYYVSTYSNKEKRKLFSCSYERSFISKITNYYYRFNKNDYIERILKITNLFSKVELDQKSINELKEQYFSLLKV